MKNERKPAGEGPTSREEAFAIIQASAESENPEAKIVIKAALYLLREFMGDIRRISKALERMSVERK